MNQKRFINHLNINSLGKISSIDLRLSKCKHSEIWYLVEGDGYVVFSHRLPRIVRLAKLYWFLYLTTENNPSHYLNLIQKLNEI